MTVSLYIYIIRITLISIINKAIRIDSKLSDINGHNI